MRISASNSVAHESILGNIGNLGAECHPLIHSPIKPAIFAIDLGNLAVKNWDLCLVSPFVHSLSDDTPTHWNLSTAGQIPLRLADHRSTSRRKSHRRRHVFENLLYIVVKYRSLNLTRPSTMGPITFSWNRMGSFGHQTNEANSPATTDNNLHQDVAIIHIPSPNTAQDPRDPI
jgi:hypothetical protein